MKVVSASAYICDIPVEQTRLDAVQQFNKQETIIVELLTDDGLLGRGYSYTIGTGGSAICALLRSDLLDLVVGEDVSRPEAIWHKLRNATRATTVGAISSLALAAVDTAVWDLRAKAAQLPLVNIAGGAHENLPVYTTEGGWLQLSIDALVESASSAKAAGMAGVKLKIGKPTAIEDARRVREVRAAIGDDMAIMVDANQAFTVDEARRRARALEPHDVAWFEEPLPADDVTGHAELARATSIPIAVGESLYSVAQFRTYLELRAATVIQVDAGRIGGVTPWLKVAHVAEAFNVAVAPHFLMELHVALACAVPAGRWVEWIPQLAPLTLSVLEISSGTVSPSREPGLGIDWDSEALAAHRVDREGAKQ